jgi:hypothetical protein
MTRHRFPFHTGLPGEHPSVAPVQRNRFRLSTQRIQFLSLPSRRSRAIERVGVSTGVASIWKSRKKPSPLVTSRPSRKREGDVVAGE